MGNRIVMIEDDAAIAQAVRLNLECADYAVTIFDNGMTAWQALETSHDYGETVRFLFFISTASTSNSRGGKLTS